MATKAHCVYCFETLAASFERREPLNLTQVEELWEQYHASKQDGSTEVTAALSEEDDDDDDDDDAEMTDAETGESSSARPAAISRLLNRESATSSNSSLPSTNSAKSSSLSSQSASGTATPASSMSSGSSRRRTDPTKEYPLFVTWNTISRSGYKSLRGCIGTFEAQELEYGLRSYAMTR